VAEGLVVSGGEVRALTFNGTVSMCAAFSHRFGHDAIQGCDYCQGFWDFALFALPAMLLDYLWHISVHGLITMRGTGRERLRVLGTGIFISAAVLEAYYLCTAEVKVPRDGFRVNMVRCCLKE
jgi:hypothetical protein